MCGRFTVTTKDTKKIADRFQVELEKALAQGRRRRRKSRPRTGRAAARRRRNRRPAWAASTSRRPRRSSSSAPRPTKQRPRQGEREARLMRWGLVPVWAKDLKVGYRMINAKTENLTKSRAYGPLVGKFRHRCLIVADGFYEWMKAEDPKQPRQPWRFTVDGGEPFAFAGLCTRKEWDDPEERGVDPDGYLYSATIITTTPNAVVKPVHDRMPAILPSAEAEAAWLDPRLSTEEAIAMCGPLDPARMAGAPANPALNKVGKGMAEGPELLVAPDGLRRRGAEGAIRLPIRFFFGASLLRLLRVLPVSLLRLLRRSAARLRQRALGFHGRLARLRFERAGDLRGGRLLRFPDRVEGQFDRRLRLAVRQVVEDVLGAFFVFGPADLHAFDRREAFRHVFGDFFQHRQRVAVGGELRPAPFSGFPGRRCRFRRSAGRASAGRRSSGRSACPSRARGSSRAVRLADPARPCRSSPSTGPGRGSSPRCWCRSP